MPFPSALHDRTFPLCESFNYRDWAGYYAVSAYEPNHEHEYHAIRHSAALFDICPLFKYRVTGREAARLIDRVITRDASAMQIGQVIYTPWCDEHGRVLDDGTISRIGVDEFRWTAAEPNLRWLTANASGLDVRVEDTSEQVGALALQGPMAAAIVRRVSDVDVDVLRYFRVTSGTVAGQRAEISRTGYTGDLGYEIWVEARAAGIVWDALIHAGAAVGVKPAGLLALDVARIEAGLLLIDVDFMSARKALTASQFYTPFEMGLGRLVDFGKARFVGRDALAKQQARGAQRQIVGVTIDWTDIEARYCAAGLPPLPEPTASRVAVPVFKDGRQVGRMTSSTWSPVLKKMLGLATVEAAFATAGTLLEVEHAVDAVRHQVGALVTRTPFFSPKRKTATPPG
jgi:aminomethyltransferase